MKPSSAEIQDRMNRVVQRVGQQVEIGLEKMDEYRPTFMRYRWPLLAAGAVLLVMVGTAMVARSRRRRPLVVRIQDALPDSVSDRLEKPLSNLRTRLSR